MKERQIAFRRTGNAPRIWLVLLIIAVLIIIAIIFSYFSKAKVEETYTERTIEVKDGKIIETELIREAEYRIDPSKLHVSTEEVVSTSYSSTASFDKKVEEHMISRTLHFPESTYIAGAIMVHGEAGGVASMTERSGCLWIACNRVMSDDPYFPDDLESVIAQAGAFDGYNPNGTYTEEDYRLAVDVFERFYREMNGETASEVGRSIPSTYLYFHGDGVHNYFTQTLGGSSYVWGSMLVSPYRT